MNSHRSHTRRSGAAGRNDWVSRSRGISAWLAALALIITPAIPGYAADTGKPAVSVKDSSGKVVTPLADSGQKATLLFFLMYDCPIGNRYAPEIARIAEKYRALGVTCYAVYSTETPQQVSGHLKEYSLPLAGLCDDQGKLALAAGATVTPEAAVFSAKGELLYRGRIDDRAAKLGAVRAEPGRRDLRLALDAILAGRAVDGKFTKAIGCYLPTARSDTRSENSTP